MADGVPEGMKRGRTPQNETWNPDVPINPVFVNRTLGYNFTLEQRLDLWKLQEQEEARAWQTEIAQIPEPYRSQRLAEMVSEYNARQSLLSESERRPTIQLSERYNPTNVWDILGTGMYSAGARFAEFQDYDVSGRYKPFSRSLTEKIRPSDVLVPESFETATSSQRQLFFGSEAQIKAMGRDPVIEARELAVSRLLIDITTDPLTWATAGAGKAVSIIGSNGEKIYLSAKGVEALAKGNFITKVINSLGEAKYYINPETRHALSKALRDPNIARQYLAKEGLKFLGFEIVPKQYLPWRYIPAFLVTAKKGVESGISPVFSAMARHTRNLINKNIPTPPAEYTALKIGYEGNLALAQKSIKQNIDNLAIEAQKAVQGRYVNARHILTDYIENPDMRRHFPELEQFRVKFEELHNQRAAIEESYGILFNSRMNYIRHYLTTQSKIYMGKLGKLKPGEMQAPFSIQRTIEGSIKQINDRYIAKTGMKLFNDDAFFLLQKRIYESETAIQTVKFLDKIKNEFGKTAKEAQRGYVKSSIIKDTWLPKQIENALRNDNDIKFLMEAMGKKSAKDVAFQITKAPLNTVYSVNKLTLGIFQRLVTRYFPGFYAQNFFGGKFMAYVFGETWGMEKETIDIMRGKKVSIVSKNGMKYSPEDIQKIFQDPRISSQIPQGVDAKELEVYLLGRVGKLSEANIRMQMVLKRLQEGDLPEDAIQYMLKYQFDYTKEMNQYETFASTVVPFWRWQSNILPLIAEMAVTQPGKMATWSKLMQATWMSPEAQVIASGPFLPYYMAGKFLYYMGGNRSEIVNVPTPIESATTFPYRLMTQPTTLLSPLLQIGYEELTGKEVFTGKPITDQPIYLARKLGFSRMMDFWKKFQDTSIPWWEKGAELGLGVTVTQGTTLMQYSGMIKDNPERMVRNSIRRLGGSWHGCGW